MSKSKFLLLSAIISIIVVLGTWFFLFRPHTKIVALESEEIGESEVLNELRKIANFSADAKTEDEARLAIERYQDFLKTYPNTLLADQIHFYIGHLYQYQLHDLPAAQREYEELQKNYPYSRLLPLVAEQIERMP